MGRVRALFISEQVGWPNPGPFLDALIEREASFPATDVSVGISSPPPVFRPMVASVTVRLLGSTAAALHRRRLIPKLPPLFSRSLRNRHPRILSKGGDPSSISPLLPSSSYAPFPTSPVPPLGSLLSLSVSRIFPSVPPEERLDCFNTDLKEGFLRWDRSWEGLDGGKLGFCGGKGAACTVVLLGWLGAEQRQLNKYAEMYRSKGISSVRFLVPVKDVVGFDLGRRVEGRIAGLARELVSWCLGRDEDGRERHLLFHTFSNAGWLA